MERNTEYILKLAQHIKKLRAEKGYIQDDLGCNGISRGMISLLETAKQILPLRN